jgi:hypothetical protein
MERLGHQNPKVLIPYPGPETRPGFQDIFVYLRPESNGVLAESTVLRVVEQCPEYKRSLHLVYLANVPGEYIVRNHIVERHYGVKLRFAVSGKQAFTPAMRHRFESYFGRNFDTAAIVGSFEALRILSLRPEELFDRWVARRDLLMVNGQSVKRIGEYFVVNYDIPALLHKNNRDTDIAVMIFRTDLDYTYFSQLVDEMRSRLVEGNLLNPRFPPSRVFHYSKGPFEQVLDGIGYLCTPAGGPVAVSDLSFATYLRDRGVGVSSLIESLSQPIVKCRQEDGVIREENLLVYTAHDTYEAALAKHRSTVSRFYIH